MASTAKPLTIGLVLDDGLDKPDGVQQYILAMGTWLTTQGHTVHYLVGQTSRTDIHNVHSMSRNVAWRFNGNRGTMPLPASAKQVRNTLAAEKYDILHIQVPYSPFMAHKLIRASDATTAIIGTFHVAPNGRVMTAGTFGLGLLLRSSLKRFHRMLSVSPAAERFASKTFRIASTISPNVIEHPRFHNAKPLEEYADEIPTILFLGRLVPRKGCKLLLEAVVLLHQLQPSLVFRVLICGRGSLEAELKQYVADNGLKDIVTFVGFISELEKPRYYASADVSVFPSSGGESFGIVLLEAMASGKAVVLAGDNPGYRSVMESQPSLLFDAHDARALATRLQDILADKASSAKLAAWGESYTKQFDVHTVGRQLLTIYRDALQKLRNQ